MGSTCEAAARVSWIIRQTTILVSIELHASRDTLSYSEPIRRLRSYLGYAFVRNARPNTTHYALAALQYGKVIGKLITQNVDGLHHKALSQVWDTFTMQQRILELHGSLHVRLLPLVLTVQS